MKEGLSDMLKVGLEQEAFYYVDGKVAVVPEHIAHDACGWLVEARGEPFFDIGAAIGSLMGALRAEEKKVIKAGGSLSLVNHIKVPREVKEEARRAYAKGRTYYRNLYGKRCSKLDHAGVHVSFTYPKELEYVRRGVIYKSLTYQMWDFVQLIKGMDKAFAQEIKDAKRVPGFYELKPDGRLEYRSLPTTVDLWKVAEVLKGLV